jgi:hypothetical protein
MHAQLRIQLVQFRLKALSNILRQCCCSLNGCQVSGVRPRQEASLLPVA